MAEMAITAHLIRNSVWPKIVKSFTGLTPRISPPMIAAKKQPVPVAESQMNGKRALSGVGFATTGLSRETLPCSGVSRPFFALPFASGVFQPGVVGVFIAVFMGLL